MYQQLIYVQNKYKYIFIYIKDVGSPAANLRKNIIY